MIKDFAAQIELKQINKELRQLRAKYNLHRDTMTFEQLDRLDFLVKQKENLLNPKLETLQIETEKTTILPPQEEIQQMQPETPINPPIVQEPTAQIPVNPSILEEDELLLESLSAPIATPKEPEAPKEKQADDFDEVISDETQAKMQQIDSDFAAKQPQTQPQNINVNLTTNEDGEPELKLSAKESADIITAMFDSFCRELLPQVYDWSLWSKDEQTEFAALSRKRRLFKQLQKNGSIDKNDVFVEDEFDMMIQDKYDRIQQYKEDAPLNQEQIRRLNLVFEVYFAKKKIDLSPESALFLGVGSVLLAKASPIVKEKAIKFIDDRENEQNV